MASFNRGIIVVNASNPLQQVQDFEAEPLRPVTDEGVAKPDPALGELNVEQRLEYLRQQFTLDAGEPPAQATAQPKPVFRFSRRAVKSAVALAVAAVVVWIPAQRLLQATSVEAVVNARTLTLRAPIEGTVSADLTDLAVGTTFQAQTPLLRITDARADRSRFDDLQRLRDRTEAEVAALKTHLAAIEQMHEEFVTQTLLFQKGRIVQLEARVEEGKSNLAAAVTRQQETAAILERALQLDANGYEPRAVLDKVKRDDEIASHDVRAAEQRIKGNEIELDSARSGAFLGDSYNDRPRSSQRADEFQQQIIELTAQLSEKQALLGQLRQDVIAENARLQLRSDAPVVAPAASKVWELLTAPGEHVERGQDLIRLVDCNAAMVTAVVSEAVYNHLQIGTKATFRLRAGDAGMSGRVVGLTGVATAAANYAIAPSSLRKEQYRVAVEVPGLMNQGCNLGRTGQVVFSDQVETSAASAVQ
jgi:multidrug resistance efflux pump